MQVENSYKAGSIQKIIG